MDALRLPDGPLEVLCVGAHPDDVEIGCGGTLLRLAERPDVSLTVAVLTGTPDRVAESEGALQELLPGVKTHFASLPDRGQQGMLNFLYLGRAMIHPLGFSNDPAFQWNGRSLIDTQRLYYDGGSVPRYSYMFLGGSIVLFVAFLPLLDRAERKRKEFLTGGGAPAWYGPA